MRINKRYIYRPNLYLACLLLLFSRAVFSQGVTFDLPTSEISAQQKLTAVTQIAVDELPQTLSPYADTPLDEQYAHLFFDPLVRWSASKGIEKRLVKKWQHKKKGRVRFYLKKNIKFHSGSRLTSKDIVWTFRHLQDYKKSKLLFASIRKIKIINKYTFDIYTKKNESELLDLLTHFFILDARFYRKHKISSNQKYGILYPINNTGNKLLLPISGTGPFKINSFNAQLNLKVERNNRYWGERSFFSLLNFVLIKSDQLRVYSLISGDVSIANNISNSLIDTIKKSKQHTLVQSPYLYSLFLTMNAKKVPAFREKSARYGLELAINQQGIVEHILKGYGSIHSPFLPDKQHDEKLNSAAVHDLQKSKALLEEALVPHYLSLLVMDTNLSTMEKITNALFNMLHRSGIQLIMKTVTTRDDWEKNKDKYDLYLSTDESYFVEKSNQYKALFENSYLAPVLQENHNLSIKNEAMGIKEYTERINFMIKEKQIIPLFTQISLYASENNFNLNQIFSENGIPYWSDLKFNKLK